jgi:hypothetical protein
MTFSRLALGAMMFCLPTPVIGQSPDRVVDVRVTILKAVHPVDRVALVHDNLADTTIAPRVAQRAGIRAISVADSRACRLDPIPRCPWSLEPNRVAVAMRFVRLTDSEAEAIVHTFGNILGRGYLSRHIVRLCREGKVWKVTLIQAISET